MKPLLNEERRREYGHGPRIDTPDTLLIGYGNPLRGTDRLGREVVEMAVAHLGPRVKAIASHQLSPEMAGFFRQVRKAIFVDADRGRDQQVEVRRVPPGAHRAAMSHGCDPAELLILAERLYHVRPEAWLIAIPASDFEWCEKFSLIARQGKDRALEEIRRIVYFPG